MGNFKNIKHIGRESGIKERLRVKTEFIESCRERKGRNQKTGSWGERKRESESKRESRLEKGERLKREREQPREGWSRKRERK